MKRIWLFFLVAVAVIAGFSIKAMAADMAQVQKEAARGGYQLITTDELWTRLSQESAPLLLIDTRQQWEYAAGHIKGAVNFPMEPTWLARLTKRGELAQLLGPDKQKTMVFY